MRWIGFLALLLPGLAAAGPWEGVWSADPAWCDRAGRIGSVTPAPIRLTAASLEGYENTCQIGEIEQIGELPAFRLGLTCQSEGSTYDEDLLILWTTSDTLWQFSGPEPVQFFRCTP